VPQLNFTKERVFTDMSMTGGCGITHQYYKRQPQFQYGFGLTYSNFSFERHPSTPPIIHVNLNSLMADGSTDFVAVSYSCIVTNRGRTDADAVVLSFIIPRPRTQAATDVTRPQQQQPAKRLVAFERVSLLPGHSEVVDVKLSAKDLASVDARGRRVLPQAGEALGLEVGDVQSPSRASLRF
jgi:beta-glucosidase